jgi:hypothetical protein
MVGSGVIDECVASRKAVEHFRGIERPTVTTEVRVIQVCEDTQGAALSSWHRDAGILEPVVDDHCRSPIPSLGVSPRRLINRLRNELLPAPLPRSSSK